MKHEFSKKDLKEIQWETLSVEAVLKKLDTYRNGISDDEAVKRLDFFGNNKLPETKKDGFIKRFLMQFNNALIYVLLGSAIFTAFMSHWIDTCVILGVIFINAIIGYLQEDKSQKALDSIQNLLSLKASVLRNGKRREIAAEKLVLGDIVLLKAGDKVPADMRLISANRFEVDESVLTGESMSVLKEIQPVKFGTVLSERRSLVYSGTTVRTGSATGVVVATAIDTEIGKINTMLSETKSTSTPLMRKIDALGTALSIIILLFSVLLIIYAVLFMKITWTDIILPVIGLSVAAIPEGLPAIITITLSIGVQRMAKKNAIVRRLPSVETLGSVTVICSDKTGTLTKNEMTATNIYTLTRDFSVSGLGYAPEGEITFRNTRVSFEDPSLYWLIHSLDLCNESDVIKEKNTWVPQGSPTEAALKTLVYKSGYKHTNSTKLNSIPFDSQYKYQASLHNIDDQKIIFATGAPEKLINICKYQLSHTGTEPINLETWESKIRNAAAHGHRLIGCAYTVFCNDKSTIDHDDLNENMIFSGFVGIIDPPRDEAINAIRVCKNAGIRVKMITGDHVLTAKEIGMKIGLTDKPKVISGSEIEKMNDKEMCSAVQNCDIFARTSPEHKIRIVKALQENGEIVAMTGDGVNDAPALKKADIGVAMGINGTEVTKDSAEMVLADDNFSSIVSAVEEGRTIYDNLKKSLIFILPSNIAQALVIVTAILFSFTLPITPVQILWVNMVTAVTLTLSLSFEPMERNIMKKPPRDPEEPLINGYFIFRMLFVSTLITAFTIFVFLGHENKGYTHSYSRTIAVNMLVLGQLFYLFNCRRIQGTIFSKGFFANKVAFIVSGILVLIQLGFTYFPFMQQWFGTTALKLTDWFYLLIGGLAILIVVEFEKWVTGYMYRIKIENNKKN